MRQHSGCVTVMFPARALDDVSTEIATVEQNGNCSGDLARKKTANGME
jgi:hypothetical protein|tara:strand:- start:5509 stop:5652 length:144 start_codon:yes stop_codon:yes gene_type:complete